RSPGRSASAPTGSVARASPATTPPRPASGSFSSTPAPPAGPTVPAAPAPTNWPSRALRPPPLHSLRDAGTQTDLARTAPDSTQQVMGPVDRPPFDAVLPLEVRQIVEIVLGSLGFRKGLPLEPRVPGEKVEHDPVVLFNVGGNPELAPALEPALDIADER